MNKTRLLACRIAAQQCIGRGSMGSKLILLRDEAKKFQQQKAQLEAALESDANSLAARMPVPTFVGGVLCVNYIQLGLLACSCCEQALSIVDVLVSDGKEHQGNAISLHDDGLCIVIDDTNKQNRVLKWISSRKQLTVAVCHNTLSHTELAGASVCSCKKNACFGVKSSVEVHSDDWTKESLNKLLCK